MQRTWAIIERELRRFRRSPTLIVISMIFPVVQLVVLGYAFGGNLKNLKVGVVDQDHGVPAVKVREMCSAVARKANRPVWAFVLCVAHNPYPVAEISHLRVQAFSDPDDATDVNVSGYAVALPMWTPAEVEPLPDCAK